MEQLEWLRENAWNVDKRIVVAMGILLWLHGVTVGIVYEGQKGLLNRFLWTFVIGVMPLWMVFKSKTWRRTATVLLYFELATFIMCCSNSLAWYRNPKHVKPLPDLGHDVLPEWKDIHIHDPRTQSWVRADAEGVPDIVMLILTISTLIFTILHPRRGKIMNRFFIVYGTLCIMRSVSVISTSLPDSAEKCRQITPTGTLSSGAHPWEEISMRVVMIRSVKLLVPVGEITCGDMVFSGHSMLMVLCAMTWHTYYKWVPGSVNYVKVSIWFITLFGLVSIVSVRMHYSLDVVLALYFTVTVWSSYHRIANDIIIGHRFSNVWVIDSLLIYPAIEWIENDTLESYYVLSDTGDKGPNVDENSVKVDTPSNDEEVILETSSLSPSGKSSLSPRIPARRRSARRRTSTTRGESEPPVTVLSSSPSTSTRGRRRKREAVAKDSPSPVVSRSRRSSRRQRLTIKTDL